MNKLKVLVLVHQDCVPPQKATIKQADWAHWKTEFYVKKTLKKLGHEVQMFGVNGDLGELKSVIEETRPSIVFNLLEEFQGEPSFESHVAAFLELMGIPYTGCNPQGLTLGRDKALSKKILNYHGILTPGFFTAELGKKWTLPKDLKFPLIVKSLNEEASLGISQDSVVHTKEKLEKRINFVHDHLGTSALVEEYIEGREFYVGVIGNKNIKVLHPWELKFGSLSDEGHPIATRTVKFNKKYCEKYEIKRGVAKNLSASQLKKIENLSRSSFKALKMSGYARLDFRLTEAGDVYFLEANPNAELADRECLANAARHSGLSYEQLISKILSLALSYELAA